MDAGYDPDGVLCMGHAADGGGGDGRRRRSSSHVAAARDAAAQRPSPDLIICCSFKLQASAPPPIDLDFGHNFFDRERKNVGLWFHLHTN